MIKSTILLLCTCLLSLGLLAQQPTTYLTEQNVPYYPDSIYDNYKSERCRLDIYYPKGEKDIPVIVWFHGGGLTEGNREIPEALKSKGLAVIAVGYRLSPKVTVPAIIEDAATAVAWAFKNAPKYGISPKKIFVSGHSAGAYLSLMITLDKSYLAKQQVDANKIAGVISFSGQTITHFTLRKERGLPDTQPVIDAYAPLYHVRKDAPPVLLLTGDPELGLLGRYEENAYLARMLKLTGHGQTKLCMFQGYGHAMTEPGFPLLLKEVQERSKAIQ